MISKGLKNVLEGLDLINNQSIFFFDKENGPAFAFPSKEIEKKLDIIKPTAFYVFNNLPYILFFDLSSNNSSEREKEIHKQVWSFDQAPIIFIVKENGVQVFNAFAYDKKDQRLQEITISEEDRNKRFSFWNLQSGSTWKWLQTEYYESRKTRDTQKRVNQRLFDNIKEVRKTLIDNGLIEEYANILILRIIFIRYLIDRNISIDKTYISGSSNIERRNSFIGILKSSRQLTDFFKYLNSRFNGVLFKDIAINLSEKNLEYLINIFDIRVDKTALTLFDRFYFDIFDFSIIPVEVISGIYESLMDKETRDLNSAVYTPSFLVDYILTDTVDKYLAENTTSECKIFDPSCGSGIFLVQSLRRMIDKEIVLYNSKIASKEFSERIREIAKNNLFGVDINPEALKVTCFSIYIALLDYQEPKDIDKYKFPDLIDENLFEANFFNTSHAYNEVIKNEKINFILGNPPWKNGKNDTLHIEYLESKKLIDTISDYQLAQSFTIRTKDFSEGDTKCCLVVTSKAIYNINAVEYRRYFLENFFLDKCFDLSPVRRLIFEGADNPAMILQFRHANKKNTSTNIVLHQSLKYNLYLKYFKALVIEKNDTKKIQQELFYKNNWMFKVALYGGVLDYNLLKKHIGDKISDFLKKKNIIEGNGIKRGTPKRHFDFLIGLPIIEMSQVEKYYTPITDSLPKITSKDTFLEAGRNIDLFKGVKILLGKRTKHETELNISIAKKDCVFKDSINAISFNSKNEEFVSLLFTLLVSDIYTYYQYLTCSNWGIYYPEIHKKEYLSFPFLEPSKEQLVELKDLFVQLIQPFEKYYSKEIRSPDLPISNNILRQINDIFYSVYNIKPFEKDLIDYVLNIARYQFQGEEKQKVVTDFTYLDKSHYRNRDLVLSQYADVFLTEFEDIYSDEYIEVKIYPLNHFIAMNFVFSKEKPKETIRIVSNKDASNEKQVFNALSKSISISQIAQDLFIQKDIKGFEENSFYIIKPNEYKCWHRAQAWYDVAEIKEAIEQAELSHLKNDSNAQ